MTSNKYLTILLLFFFAFGKAQTTILMEKRGGVYEVPCKVNGLVLKFIFDTGAYDVSISLTEALFMLKQGYLLNSDIVGKQYFRDATGHISEGTKITIRVLEFGGLTLYNVEASIVGEMNAPLLLGQTVLSKLGPFQVSPEMNTLTILNGNNTGNIFINNKQEDYIVKNDVSRLRKNKKQIIDKINSFLSNKQYVEALAFVDKLLELEPHNDGALFIKGLAYEKIGNEDSVTFYYNKSIEANPNNINPVNNLGAWYVNKGNDLVGAMNKLGRSEHDIRRYDDLKSQQKDFYRKAKPYIERAHDLDPNNEVINRTLNQIGLKLK